MAAPVMGRRPVTLPQDKHWLVQSAGIRLSAVHDPPYPAGGKPGDRCPADNEAAHPVVAEELCEHERIFADRLHD
ncbi:MAG: hypothetical protein H7836_14945 [Magnetococcus sp. YQC-3]